MQILVSPCNTFRLTPNIDIYNAMPDSNQLIEMTDEYLQQAKDLQHATRQDVLPADGNERSLSQLLISTGTVVKNMSVPPSGGCVVSVKVKFDDGHEVLTYPGSHQLFFYGDFKYELEDFCQLFNYKSVLV